MAMFAQITDLHLRPLGVLTLGTVDADAHAAAAIDAVIARHPDITAVLVTGDITDLGEVGAYERAVTLLSRFAVPVLVMPGNHDRTAALRDAFSAFRGVADRPVPDKVCHAHLFGDWKVIALDTSIDRIAETRHEGALGDAQLSWLEGQLADGVPTLIAMHHPPFKVGIGFMDAIPLTDADAFAAVIARHPHVARIVCGHVHRVILGHVAGVPALAVPGVAHQVRLALDEGAPAELVMEPPAYGLHMALDGAIVSHVGYVGAFGEPKRMADQKAAAEPPR